MGPSFVPATLGKAGRCNTRAMSRYDDLRKMREARFEAKTADATKPVKHDDAVRQPVRQFPVKL
jgi:hypothetical protein